MDLDIFEQQLYHIIIINTDKVSEVWLDNISFIPMKDFSFILLEDISFNFPENISFNLLQDNSFILLKEDNSLTKAKLKSWCPRQSQVQEVLFLSSKSFFCISGQQFQHPKALLTTNYKIFVFWFHNFLIFL